MDLKNGTVGVELPKRVSSAMEHVCYLFLLTLEHVRYLSWVIHMYIRTYVCMYGTTHTCVRIYTSCGSGHALGLSKETHNVDPGTLVCCEQQ
jgi:hypothetical protein